MTVVGHSPHGRNQLQFICGPTLTDIHTAALLSTSQYRRICSIVCEDKHGVNVKHALKLIEMQPDSLTRGNAGNTIFTTRAFYTLG